MNERASDIPNFMNPIIFMIAGKCSNCLKLLHILGIAIGGEEEKNIIDVTGCCGFFESGVSTKGVINKLINRD